MSGADVRPPAGRARDDEDRGEEGDRDRALVVGRRRVEVRIRIPSDSRLWPAKMDSNGIQI